MAQRTVLRRIWGLTAVCPTAWLTQPSASREVAVLEPGGRQGEPTALASLAGSQPHSRLPVTWFQGIWARQFPRTFCGLCKTRLLISPLQLWDLSSSDLLSQFHPILLLSFQTWAALVAFLSCCLCSLSSKRMNEQTTFNEYLVGFSERDKWCLC